jgi:hypothetical protein
MKKHFGREWKKLAGKNWRVKKIGGKKLAGKQSLRQVTCLGSSLRRRKDPFVISFDRK